MAHGFLLIYVLASALPIVTPIPTSANSTKSTSRDTYKVYRIFPNTTEEFDSCVDIWKSSSKYRLNFWKEPTRVGSPIDVMVPSRTQGQFKDLLNEHGLDYMVTIGDVQKLIEERERRPMPNINFDKILRDDSAGDGPFYDFSRYYPYEHMRLYMRDIERSHPDIAKVYTIGFSVEGRPIEMIKIGSPLTKRGKKSIWIDGGIHAREWPATTTALYFMQELAGKFNRDPIITQYVEELNWFIVPCLNPDGYEYSRSSSDPDIRLWRKNRAPNGCRRRGACCMGVDLNRNFDFHWGESGSSRDPCDEVYQGSSPFSEPESKAVRDFIWNHRSDIQAVVTMHTYSQIWIHPFGHQRNSYPPDVSELHSIGLKAAVALEKLYGTKYRVGSGADTLYPASGGSDDWSKTKAGIKYVYLLELRPEDAVVDGFILPPSDLLPTARETWEGVKAVANAVLKKLGIKPTMDGGDDENKQSGPFSSRRTNKRVTRNQVRPKIKG